VAHGTLELVEQVFFEHPVRFRDFEEFHNRVIGVTHTHFHLTEEILAEVRRRFDAHVTAAGASFLQPMRVDLLRKAGAAQRTGP
jgi:hypothetical protein